MVALLPTQQGWLWEASDVAIALLVLTYVVLVGVLATRRLYVRGRHRREQEARRRLGQMLAQIEGGSSGELRAEVGRLGELERPIGAELLLARFEAIGEDDRRRLAAALEQVGAIELMRRGLRRWMPWRKALAAQLLGHCRAAAAVPDLIALVDHRSLQVRDAAVLALGRIGDPRALPVIVELIHHPRRAPSSGVRFEALMGMPRAGAAKASVDALASPDPRVGAAACLGVALTLEAEDARELLRPVLANPSAAVRAAAAAALGQVGGERVPPELAAGVADSEVVVRRAATRALASYNDAEAVALTQRALDDADREVAIYAGEALVQLSNHPHAGVEARRAVEDDPPWPVQRALVLAEVGAL